MKKVSPVVPLLLLAVLGLSTATTVYLGQQSTDNRSRAGEAGCGGAYAPCPTLVPFVTSTPRPTTRIYYISPTRGSYYRTPTPRMPSPTTPPLRLPYSNPNAALLPSGQSCYPGGDAVMDSQYCGNCTNGYDLVAGTGGKCR